MADSLLSFGVEKLWDLLVRETERFQGVEEQFNVLKSDLNMLRCFLKDADAKKHTSAMVRNTVEEIKEIVYDAEDIIETFLLKEELGKTSGIKKRIRQFAGRRGLAFDMEALSKKIAKVIRNMQSLGVQQVIVNENDTQTLTERQREMRQTFPSNNEDHLIVGLEKNIEQVVGYLVEENRSQVVSITGMGGIGKTTLARQVFNHEMVKNHFDGVAWVCISQQFTQAYVWQTILQQLSSKQDDQRDSNMSKEELQGKLFRLLETSNSLIVLDDMWNEEDWDRIKHAFPSKKGWKVLLTSRNENVAFRADPTCVTIKPECLTFDECWTLFRRTTFYRENATESEVDVEMEEMGKQMIKHCGGLPLAVKVLGGLLATQHTLSDWKRISGNIKSGIIGGTSFNDRNMSSVFQILYLSFEELPIYLKNCFLYLAHYPEDKTIGVEMLSYYWAAEGIPRPKNYDGATIREVADGYIEELVKRNMVISERDIITLRFEDCHLHDMMREVCLRKAKEENFVHIVDTCTLPTNSQSPCNSRRITIHRLDETYDLVGKMKNLKIRSLLFSCFVKGRMTWDLSFRRLQLLRVLDLSFVKFEGGKLPSSIGKLIHLRHLNLFEAEVTHLPSSMRNLRKMLYLNLLGLNIIYMPNFLEELRELKFLCLPSHIKGKTKLKLGNLVNLEILVKFSTEHSSVEDLQQMTRLTSLDIRLNSEGCTTETISSSLSKLRHLEDLTIHDVHDDREGFVLDCLHLKQLTLEIYMSRLPDEQHFPSRLTIISLTKCCLEEDPMPILEKLLQLKEVQLRSQSFSGRRMVCSGGGFPQLRKLLIFELKEWEEWIVEEGSMPLLHTLKIWDCPKLEEIPNGLRFLYETLLSVRVEKLWGLLVQESERFQGVEEQFNVLKSDLNMLRCSLKDADAKKHTSAMVSNTLKEVKEIVYDAEDIIETFLLKEELGKPSGIKKRIRQLACVIVDRRKIALNMEVLSKRIAKVIRDMQSLGVQQVIVNENGTQSLTERQREMRQTFPSNNEDHPVGLEKNVRQLVGYLVEEDRSQVVSITGMGGIGKTTLARQVFNHKMVKNHFDGVAWVCISQQFTQTYVWKTILQQLNPKQTLSTVGNE